MSDKDSSGLTRATASRQALAVYAVLLLCILVNLPSIFSGFIRDDHTIIEANELVRDLSHAPALFTSNYWNTDDPSGGNLYRPVTTLSFAIHGALGGASPFGFRLVNLLFHVLVTLLVLLLARIVFAERSQAGSAETAGVPTAATIAAILFAIHPVHTEVLGEVVGRADLLAAAGTLGCLLAFLAARDREAGSERRSTALFEALSIACFAAGFLSKENAVVAPFLVLLADRLLVGRRLSVRYHVAAGATLVAMLVLRWTVLGGSQMVGSPPFADNPIVHASFLEGRLTALDVLARYALLLVAPIRLSVDYSYNAIPIARGLSDPWAILGMAVVALWGASAWAIRKRSPGTAFAIAWIGLTLLPTANLLFPIGTIMAERLLYLPSVGFCLVAAGAIHALRERLVAAAPSRMQAGAAGMIVPAIALAFGARTEARLLDWRDEYTLMKSALAVTPDSFKVQNGYGVETAKLGNLEEARQAHQRSIDIWPDFAESQWNLGYVLLRLGRDQEAREVLRRATLLDPRSYEAHLNLGAAELRLNDPRAASESFRVARSLHPEDLACHLNLGLALEAAREFQDAADTYRGAARRFPEDPRFPLRLGLALMQAGDQSGAREALERAVALDPTEAVVDAESRALLLRLRDSQPR